MDMGIVVGTLFGSQRYLRQQASFHAYGRNVYSRPERYSWPHHTFSYLNGQDGEKYFRTSYLLTLDTIQYLIRLHSNRSVGA